MFTYDFDHLAGAERFEILLASPLVHQIAELLPVQGITTKPAKLDNVAMLALGAATVMWGSDATAEAELRYAWPRIRLLAERYGARVPVDPPSVQLFRDYRQRFLTAAVVESLSLELEDQAVGVAIALGLLPEDEIDLLDPSALNVIAADGFWLAEASSVGRMVHDDHINAMAPHRSRGKTTSRVCDFDDQGKVHGYFFIDFQVRGPEPRRKVCLSTMPASMGKEMAVVEAGVRRLRSSLGKRFAAFVYDGAMRGKHHKLFRTLGILTVNKPHGTKKLDQFQTFKGKVVDDKVVITRTVGEGCVVQLDVTAGLLWQLERRSDGRHYRKRVLEAREVRMTETTRGAFEWEQDFNLICDVCHEDHLITLDPNGTLKASSKTINLAETLRILPTNGSLAMRETYGLRNGTEAYHRQLKTDTGYGDRAGSFARHHVGLDTLLFQLAKNALAYAEHGPTELVRPNFTVDGVRW